MHFQYIRVTLLTYSLEKHFPSRDSAIFIASLKDNFLVIAVNETIPSKKQNPFAPKYSFRLLVAGTSESGKMSIIVHLLIGSKYPKIYPWMSGKKHGHKIPKEAIQCFYKFIAMDKQAPWYENVRFKLIAPEELPDISSFKRTSRFTVIVFDDLASEPLATQLKIISFFSEFLKIHTHDVYEPLAKKIYEVIKKHFVVIDIQRPSNDPLSIRFRWDKSLKDWQNS
ncbi:13369_t:CDS:2 [Racocetra fulgida]|uniref:13369_t:CDS:1 n=1 Tax=Racocetra fulgida TaxID=60492 RepID=A0A9N8VV73_9GLOM|nr:13369_t:CDS:2 [Racocetra fulgida]